MRALLGLFAVLSIVDLVQTYFFPRYGLREANPLVARILGQFGFDDLVLAKYAVFAVLLIASAEGLICLPALVLACALQAAVVGWNGWKMYR